MGHKKKRWKENVCVKLAILVKLHTDTSTGWFQIHISGEHSMAVPTGTVNVTDTISSTVVATGTLDASGSATLSWTSVAGTYNFVANYLGDSAFN